MTYQGLLRQLREIAGLTQRELATKAGLNKTSVFNAEGGKQVRFPTVAKLALTLGYGETSPEMRDLALLWMESATGLRFSHREVAADLMARQQISLSELYQSVIDALAGEGLNAEEIGILVWAIKNPDTLEHLRISKRLADYGETTQQQHNAAGELNRAQAHRRLELAAEDPEVYPEGPGAQALRSADRVRRQGIDKAAENAGQTAG